MTAVSTNVSGEFSIICWNPDGTVAWSRTAKNAVTTAGLDYLGGTALAAVTQITTWYIGFIDSAGFTTGLAAGDTLASHAGWSENTSYSGNRKQWVNAEANKLVYSTAAASFVITANGSIHGLLLCSAASGTSGTLWCTALLDVDAPLSTGQTITVGFQASFAGG